CYSSFLQQQLSQKTLRPAEVSKFVFGIWLLCCLIIASVYKGLLFSFMTATKDPLVINKLDDIMKENYDFISRGHTSVNQALMTSKGGDHKIIRSRYSTVKTPLEGYQQIMSGKKIAYMDITS